MKRRREPNGPGVGTVAAVVGALAVVAGLVGLSLAGGGGGGATHYEVLPGCTGIVIRDLNEALKAAGVRGETGPAYSSDWVAQIAGALGVERAGSCANYPPQARAFAYRLVRQWMSGAVRAKKATRPAAETALAALREQMRRLGVGLELLPEGVP